MENVKVMRKRKTKSRTSKEEECFRVIQDSMSTGDLFESRVNEERLQELKLMYNIPDSIRWKVPKRSDKPCYVKDGKFAI